ESVIYEAHVKGMTKCHPDVPEEIRGTYAGLAHPAIVEHFTSLGVTAVELMPVHQFVHDHRLVEQGLRNYWGYNTIGFFAPHNEYAASGNRGDQVNEFRYMVRTLHEAGIEVILDVVYNHTAEGNHLGPTLCFKGIDNRAYYRLVGKLASRLTGSSDLYQNDTRRPVASINFVTAHDGFTLRDLVSYNLKHNEANGEFNADGESHNRSWNCGVEGDADDPAVLKLRA